METSDASDSDAGEADDNDELHEIGVALRRLGMDITAATLTAALEDRKKTEDGRIDFEIAETGELFALWQQLVELGMGLVASTLIVESITRTRESEEFEDEVVGFPYHYSADEIKDFREAYVPFAKFLAEVQDWRSRSGDADLQGN